VRRILPRLLGLVPLLLASRAFGADLVLYNGKVLIADHAFSIVEAIAIRDGKVSAVGRNSDILRHASARTRLLDLKGKTVIPGLIDTHATLFEYALVDHRDEFEQLEPRARQLRQISIHASSGPDALSKIAEQVRQAPPGHWLRFRVRPVSVALDMWHHLKVGDLDRVTPNNPVMLTLVSTQRLLNAQALEAIRRHYGQLPEDLPKDPHGRPTGRGRIALVRMVALDLAATPETLAPVFKKTMEQWASHGVTTWSAPVEPVNPLKAYAHLDRNGEMPIRFAYSHAMGAAFSQPPGFYEQLGDSAGNGTPHLWNIGASTGAIDGAYPRLCTTIEARPEVKALEECRAASGSFMRGVLHAMVRSRLRLSGIHVAGDGAADHFMDTVESASREAGLTLEQIRKKRHAIDHCWLNPRPDQIERAKRLGIIWSCSPIFLLDGEKIQKDYGERYVRQWSVPVRSILDAGGKVVMETDDADLGRRGAFWHIQTLVTRKDMKGNVWGKDQAIDRKTALLMFTRWAAEYVLREDVLGSLQPGKWADLVVIDRDFLSIPDDEISGMKVLLTAVGGKLIYTAPDFARAEGLPQVGFRGTPEQGYWTSVRTFVRDAMDWFWGDRHEPRPAH
jgi:predicted amidohydrolase YtcJ